MSEEYLRDNEGDLYEEYRNDDENIDQQNDDINQEYNIEDIQNNDYQEKVQENKEQKDLKNKKNQKYSNKASSKKMNKNPIQNTLKLIQPISPINLKWRNIKKHL